MTKNTHYKGKNALQHLIEARYKGTSAGSEPHGIEASGRATAFWDSARSSIIFHTLFALMALTPGTSFYHPLSESKLLYYLLVMTASLGLWFAGRSFFLARARLSRMEQALKEEKREVEKNRAEEKSELRDIYALKGFEGKLLDEVVEVLASDKNRLLQIMLEEELGLAQFSQDHPLKQGFFAGLGTLFFGTLFSLAWAFLPLIYAFLSTGIFFLLISIAISKLNKANTIESVVSQFALALGAVGFIYFIRSLIP
jgi:vacuolar iron transporter family protein